MSRWLSAALSLASSIVLACGDPGDGAYHGTTERHGKDLHTFYVNNGGEPEYVDPGKAHDSASTKLIDHLFEGLTGYGPDAEIVPAAAQRFDKTDDSLYYRFHLREDGRWSDGKPVTAHDFEYAWKRALDPTTASLSAVNLYWVKNGELFNQGKLLTAKEDTDVREQASAGAKQVASFPKGGAVRVLSRSPVRVSTAIPAFGALPEGVTGVSYDAPNPKKKLPEKLSVFFDRDKKELAPDPAQALPEGDYDVIAMKGATSCNGDRDHFFELVARDGSGKRGVLPGCMLSASKAEGQWMLVARWDAVPTFDPNKRIEANPDAPPLGFVSASAFGADTSLLGVRATSDLTLEIEAEYPVPYMLDVLRAAVTYPVRKDVVEPFKERGEPDMWTRPETLVNNGPYVVSDWRFRYEIRMKRNPHHRYHDKLKIHEIVWLAVESYVSTMNLYKAGEIDFIGDNASLPPAYLPFLSAKKDFERREYLATYWYELNTKVPPLDNVKVRQALNLAIDKQQLVDKITRGGQIPATHFVPNFTQGGYAEEVAREAQSPAGDMFASKDRQFDPEHARALLSEAGYPVVGEAGSRRAEGLPSIEVLYNTSEAHKAIAVAIQSMWKEHLGVSVSLRNEEWHVMQKNVRDGNFQVVRYGWIGEFDHPQTFMDTFMAKSPANKTGWSSQRFEELIGKARTTADSATSMRLYRAAERIISDEVPKIPLYFYTKVTLIKPYVKGFHFNQRNQHMIHWLWIDPRWKDNPSDEPAMAPESFAAPGAY